MSAALAARRLGAAVVLVDERSDLGGQIYKRVPHEFRIRHASDLGEDYAAGEELIRSVRASEVDIRLNSTAWGIWGQDVAVHQEGRYAELITARQIVLATGAYDRPIVFPGWTLPGVLTAGAAQSLVKIQRILPGHRILMVGTGPLLLAFAAQLRQHGARIVAVCDANPPPRIEGLRLAVAARGNLKALRRGIAYHAYLRSQRVPFLYSHLITSVEGGDRVEVARVTKVDADWMPATGSTREINVDTVCLGYGFVPSNELSILSGCKHVFDHQLGGLVPKRDAHMRSSSPHVLVAGDGAGVEGVDVARAEGSIAGTAAAAVVMRLDPERVDTLIAPLRDQLRTARRFASALHHAFPVADGAYRLAKDDTIVCRCEGVTTAEIWKATELTGADASGVKNVTRAGMGFCQGRNCSPHVAGLVARRAGLTAGQVRPFNTRPPVKPIPIGTLRQLDSQADDTEQD